VVVVVVGATVVVVGATVVVAVVVVVGGRGAAATVGDGEPPAHAAAASATAASVACHHRRVASTSRKGRLLIALPMLADPNFDRTIVLMIEDSEEGSAGLVLNRPSELAVTEALPDFGERVAAPAVVFVGGPVSQNTAIGLARSADTEGAEGWQQVMGDVGTFNMAAAEVGPPEGITDLRVFAGYAGWGPGQLEGEISAGAWLVVDADVGDVLSSDPLDLWRSVLKRQRGTASWLANYPADLNAN